MGQVAANGPGFLVGPGRERGGRRSAAAAALATLAVIVASNLSANVNLHRSVPPPGPDEPGVELSDLARRALDELPAFRVENSVVVMAYADKGILWDDPIPDRRIDGRAVPILSGAVQSYSTMSFNAAAPDWVKYLTPSDNVLVELEPLSFACVRAHAGDTGCEPSLVVYHDLRFYPAETGLGPSRLRPGDPMTVNYFDTPIGNEMGRLLVGRIPSTDVAQVWVTLADGSKLAAKTSVGIAIPTETVFSARISGTAVSVAALGRDGSLVSVTRLG